MANTSSRAVAEIIGARLAAGVTNATTPSGFTGLFRSTNEASRAD
jgi:hypothetical protein